MVKQIFLVKRKPGTSFDEYKKYYLGHHVPLVKKTMPGICKYVINFALQRGKETPWDSIGELFWDDIESIVKFFKSDDYKNIIAPDEEKFIDREASQVILTEETIQK
jgi:uncharacterized protein (TIGR02118 family)